MRIRLLPPPPPPPKKRTPLSKIKNPGYGPVSNTKNEGTHLPFLHSSSIFISPLHQNDIEGTYKPHCEGSRCHTLSPWSGSAKTSVDET